MITSRNLVVVDFDNLAREYLIQYETGHTSGASISFDNTSALILILYQATQTSEKRLFISKPFHTLR